MPLIIYGLSGVHANTDAHIYFGGMKVISKNQVCALACSRRVPGLEIVHPYWHGIRYCVSYWQVIVYMTPSRCLCLFVTIMQ